MVDAFFGAMGDQLDLQRGCRLRSALSTQPGLHETDPIKTLGTKAQERFPRRQNFMCVLSTLLPGKVHDSRWERTSRCIVLGSAWALPHIPPPLAVCFNFFLMMLISLAPAKSGLRVHTSAMRQPTAQMSMEEHNW